MAFQKLHYNQLSETKMVRESELFLERFNQRRTIRDFSDKSFSIEIIQNAIKTASSAPSGANKQPWHFVIVQDFKIKKEIRIFAEKEEKEFYDHRAPKDWIDDLNQFGTNWQKPFLEIAPYLIVVFKQSYDLGSNGKKKNYYVNESVGIASGFLLAALHNAGLVTLTHTPSPMGFLEKILKRPKNERAYIMIPVGYPAEDAMVPNLKKKPYSETIMIK